MGGTTELTGPDLEAGVALAEVQDGGMLLGHAHGEAVLLARRGEQVFAVGATCSHYSGPLAEGILDGNTVHCPWHHACFDLRTGAPHAPGLNPIPCFKVERAGDRVKVGDRVVTQLTPVPAQAPAHVVVVGAGAAAQACVEQLRREGYRGRISLLGAESTVPVDRPNLSKDYLAGKAPEEWIPLRPREFFAEQGIELHTDARVTAVDAKNKQLTIADGRTLAWDALVLATGATPNRLTIPGANRPNVFYLRSLADSRAIIARTANLQRAVVLGASFIGLEVAASLRERNIEVHVVAPDRRPLERVLGPELGEFIRTLHEERGVIFHLERTPTGIDDIGVQLERGGHVPGEIVVAGIGVHPNLELAQQAGCTIDRGVVVDEYLQTSVPGIYAVGDIARWPDPRSGHIRVEHWVVAERQGQAVARSLVGKQQPFRDVPFFWSQHYDVSINYVGHVDKWDSHTVYGAIPDRNCVVAYRVGGKVRAAASIYRDRDSLNIEAALARDDQAAIEQILGALA